MAIGAAAPSNAAANLGGSFAIIASVLFGGYLMNADDIPPLMRVVSRLSFIKCVGEGEGVGSRIRLVYFLGGPFVAPPTPLCSA